MLASLNNVFPLAVGCDHRNGARVACRGCSLPHLLLARASLYRKMTYCIRLLSLHLCKLNSTAVLYASTGVQGCLEKVEEKFTYHAAILIGIAIGVAMIQVEFFCTLFAT